MEEGLSKTSEGQDRLGRAKDRLDTRVAEIGQAELDKKNDEQKTNQAQEDNVEGDVNEQKKHSTDGPGQSRSQYSKGCPRSRKV